MTHILGISASLRNSRLDPEQDGLCVELKTLSNEENLFTYLNNQASLLLAEFQAISKNNEIPFDQVYKELVKNRKEQGLSNSEIAVAAGLWGAYQEGSEISHLSLGSFFPARGDSKNLEALRERVRQADAILLSGPVYFGDRGSLANEFIEFLRKDKLTYDYIKNKLYAGITVGAKRNGGQETTLIYQLNDLCNLNMLAVGNSSETTSQYGGTVVAGDIGTACSDTYGLKTAIGTGRRLARVSKMMHQKTTKALKSPCRIAIWLLQDDQNKAGLNFVNTFCQAVKNKITGIEFQIRDFTDSEVRRCIACDICPTHVGEHTEYRCIIKSKTDEFFISHESLLEPDAILLAAYSPVDTRSLKSVYQRFIERTRYIRRDDYAIGDKLTAPLILSEVNANQNLHIRMLTSMIRHHMILHKPLLGFQYENDILNWDFLVEQGVSFAKNALQLTLGKLLSQAHINSEIAYNPIGYILSAEENERTRLKKEALRESRLNQHLREKERLV